MKYRLKRIVSFVLTLCILSSSCGDLGLIAEALTLSRTLKTGDGRSYEVSVRFDPAAGIPENAELRVTPIEDGEDSPYHDYAEQSVDLMGVRPDGVDFVRAFDISLVDPETGAEYQPDKNVRVSIRLLDVAIDRHKSVGVVHFSGDADGDAEAVSARIKGKAVQFDADAFSVYVVVGSDDFLDKLGKAQNGDTIRLNDDMTVSNVSVTKDLTIDLNNHTLTVSTAITASHGKLTIENGSVTSGSELQLQAYNNGAIDLGDKLTVVGADLEIQAYPKSTEANKVTVAGATVGNVTLPSGAGLVVSKGSVNGTVDVGSGGKLTVSGGTIHGAVSATTSTVMVSGGTLENTVTMNGGTLTVSGGSVNGAVTANNAIVLVPGGTIASTVDLAGYAKLTVSGGTVEGKISAVNSDVTVNSGEVGNVSVRAEGGGAKLVITGGTVSGNLTSTNAEATISGGEFEGSVTATGSNVSITGGNYVNPPTGAPISATQITITADSAERPYDGTPLTADGYTVSTGLVGEDKITSVTVTGSQTDIGESDNVPSNAVISSTSGTNYIVIYQNGKLTVTKGVPVVTAPTPNVLLYDGTAQELVTPGATTGGTLKYSLDDIEYSTGIPTGTDPGVYTVYYKVEGNETYLGTPAQTVSVEILSAGELIPLTITADSGWKIYDGIALTKDGYTVSSGLLDGHHIKSVKVEGSQTKAGTSFNVASEVVIVDEDDKPVTGQYFIKYVSGELTVKPAPVVLSANGGTAKFNSGDITLGYTCSKAGVTFSDEVATEAYSTIGLHRVDFVNVTPGETLDTTGNYVVVSTNYGMMIIESEGDVLKKQFIKVEKNLAYYRIDFNPDALILNDGNPLTIKDTFSSNQSINYASIEAECEPSAGENVTWDYSGYTGTFIVPDSTHVTITYYTRVIGSTGKEINLNNRAELGVGDPFFCITAAETDETVRIEPDIYGTNGVYTIGLYVYAQNHMETGLGGATFRLLDADRRPITYAAGENIGEDITFTTSDGEGSERRGYVTIALDEATDGVAIHKNTAYYLEMVTAPYTLEGGVYTYYQLDNTYYSFLVTDNPSYTYGGIYSYFNGDVLKVRCYSDQRGVNVTKRFSGNYELTDEQMNEITFTLQKEVFDGSGSNWVDVESHTYEEFRYGRITFNTGATALEDAATYRVVETNDLPEELEGSIELNQIVSVSYQEAGVPVIDPRGEFFVDPDDKDQVYSFVFTNEYVDHKLIIVKVDELTGKMLEGVQFSVYNAADESTPLAVYSTGEDGKLRIGKTENYEFDTLYYAVETQSIDGFILPNDPQKIYFYFSNQDTAVPEGLPAGETATDLTATYVTVPVLNRSSETDIPVVVTWGRRGTDEWPDSVKSIRVGLYSSVNGAAPTAVTDGENPMRLTLTEKDYYDTLSFKGLPTVDAAGNLISYSVKEEAILDSSGNDVTRDFAQTFSISGTGWYVVNNRDSVRVTVQKQWNEKDGVTPVADTSEKEAVVFDLFRTTASHTGKFTREELLEFLGSAEPVRTDLTLDYAHNWTLTVESLEKTDNNDAPWYYYALEDVPDNQIDTYVIAAATETANRSLTIHNQQTPSTVTITASDLQKAFGESDPALVLSATVMEEGSSVEIDGAEGSYTATITRGDGTTAIPFTVSRNAGENIGSYTINMQGTAPEGYRLVFVPGTLTITRARITITAGATKIYGDPDPTLVTIEGLPDGFGADALSFTAVREADEDIGTYPILLAGDEEQGNFHVTFVPGDLIITRATATVTAIDTEKQYGEEDPVFTAAVCGMQNDDSEMIIEYDLTRTEGENVGTYTILPSGETEQGNYTVVYMPGTLTIDRAPVTISVEDTSKVYGDVDPDWSVTIDGLSGEDDGGILTASNGGYSYCRPGSDTPILFFDITREAGEDVGEYKVTPTGDEEQGNYTVSYSTEATLSITCADLYVTANEMVKAKLDPAMDDPVLTASIFGWANGDDESVGESSIENGVVTWTYTRNDKTVLTFTLTRAEGEDEGDYEITASGNDDQGNYYVYYEPGVFSILSMFSVDVSQTTTDLVDPESKPAYSYRAVVDLSGTGLSGSYNDNDFANGVLEFSLPHENAELKTLRVPAGAKLTVTQISTDVSYDTSITLDNDPYYGDELSCVINGVDDFYAIRFAHDRINLPVLAMTATEESEAGETITGSSGYVGVPIPTTDVYQIDGTFVENYRARMGYALPTDKYYVYDHAALYRSDGEQIETEISAVMYDTADAVWKYCVTPGEYQSAPADAQLRLFYLPKYICRIDAAQFYTLNEAVSYVANSTGKSGTIEMLLQEYPVPESDTVTIPAGCDITLKSASELTEGAIISRSSSLSGQELIINNGTLTLVDIIVDGKGVSASKSLISSGGANATLTVGDGAVLRNGVSEYGGAITVTGGEADVAESLINNRATYGGAMYITGGTVKISVDSVTGNEALHGGAVYMTGGTLNVTGYLGGNTASDNGGAVYMAGGTLNVEGTIAANEATNGGAVFLTGGTANVLNSVSGNSATDGGAFYMEGGTIAVTGGAVSNNIASGNGGAVYGTNGDLTVSGGSFVGNTASGNGGAVWYGGGGTVDVTNGSFAGNAASGNGGAIFQSAGTVTLTDGSIGGSDEAANSASNGSAIFVAGGSASFSGVSITMNTATNGGAVGVGSVTARLHFSGDTTIKDNMMGSVKNNVYLDQDSDLIINSSGLGSNASIGVYVSDALTSTRGDACTQFGSYTSPTNANKFTNDRSKVLDAYYDTYKLIWSRFIQYHVRYVSSMDLIFGTGFTPTGVKEATGTAISSGNKKYYPVSTENPIYDLVTDLYSKQFGMNNNDFQAFQKKEYVYAYTYVYQEKSQGPRFEHFLTDLNWNSKSQKWDFMQSHSGEPYGNADAKTIIIYYTDASYLSVTNNSEHTLTIDPLTVLGENLTARNYGYPTVVNYLTQNTLIPINDLVYDADATDRPYVADGKIVIPPSGYVKLLVPGAVDKDWSMTGYFTASADSKFHYTLDSLNTPSDSTDYKKDLEVTVEGNKHTFTLSGKTLSKGETYDVLFEERTPVCKIVDENSVGTNVKANADGKYEHPFATLNEAWEYIEDNSSVTKVRTIEMLMDYQQPGTDVPEFSEGYDITLTTAAPRGTEGVPFTYFGANPDRATISRDNTNDGAAVIALAQSGSLLTKAQCISNNLTVHNLIFDGKALAKAGNGGAISTDNYIVSITDCDFKGYQANRGGAIFVNGGDLTITNCNFTNCYTKSSTDKCGGGAIWTTAQVLTVNGTNTFTNCACNQAGNAQGGAIFHNIRYGNAPIYKGATLTFPAGYSAASKTYISGCNFQDCFSVDGSGGTVESDAWEITMENCRFDGSYTGKENGNGGALNAYTNDNNSVTTIDSKLTIRNCWFEGSSARKGTKNLGGAIRTKTRTTLIENTTFKDCWACMGGAIYNDSGAEISLTINGCTFDGCYATVEEGAVYTNAPTLLVEDYDTGDGVRHSLFKDCTAPKYGGIFQNKDSNGSTATVIGASFENCVSTASESGALHTKAKTLSITGIENVVTFKDCSASGNGGAICHTGTTETLTDCSFKGCTSGGSGGGAYLNGTLKMSGGSFSNCLAVNSGGGLYTKPAGTTSSMSGCEFSGNTLSATESKGGSLYVDTNDLTMTNCSFSNSIAAYGGGVYNTGAMTFKSGSISGCKALISGGGLYSTKQCGLGVAETPENQVAVSGCYAVTAGGGVYQTAKLSLRSVTVSGCCAAQGGGVYSANELYAAEGYVFSITDCHAKSVAINSNGNVTVGDGYSADNQGGGIYKTSTIAWTLSSTAGEISGCSAYDGGGIYFKEGEAKSMAVGSIAGNTAAHNGAGIYQNSGTIGYSGGVAGGNSAAGNGGGIYKAGGTLTISGGTIGGSAENANVAVNGAGFFAADGQTVTVSGGSITYNRATTAGGGIAVGAGATLYFQGSPVVRFNTMGAEESAVECNVYLDQDNNAIIRTTGTPLGAGTYIGVYCADDQDAAHGMGGMPFGTYNKSDCLNCFINDRRPYYCGMKGSSGNLIVWSSFTCKITDGSGNLLYKDAKGTPAAYAILENNGGSDKTNAFGTLANDNPGLFQKIGDTYTPYTGSNGYQVQMLVQEYAVSAQILIKKTKSITLTTASPEPDECGLCYGGDQKHPRALIIRNASYGSMIKMDGGTPSLTMESIIIDGGSEKGLTSGTHGGILYVRTGAATVGAGATLQNSDVGTNYGGGIRVENSSANRLTLLDGGLITNCKSTAYGGGVSIKLGSFTMNGGSITNCSAKYGGGARVDTTMYMNGGTITGNSATFIGGGISPGVIGAKIFFSGTPIVMGNTLNGVACNFGLGFASSVIINANGLKNGAEIGVYAPDKDENNKSVVFENHGGEGDPFGYWTAVENPALYCFVNDRNEILRGSRGGEGDQTIYWARNFVLTVGTEVDSDLTSDANAEFSYRLQINSTKFQNRTFSGVAFDKNGAATLKIKPGNSTTLYFPDEGSQAPYTVTLSGVTADSSDTGLEDFTSAFVQNGGTDHQNADDGDSVSGTLGENLTITPPSGRSNVVFTHTRLKGSLTVAKTVRGMEESADPEFLFILRLGDAGITKSFATVNQAEVNGTIAFNKGVATFRLHDGESLRINGLPTDLDYTVEEDLSEIPDAARIRTRVVKDDGAETIQSSQTGTIGEAYTETDGRKTFASVVTFINSYLEIVCKITNRNRVLLYYTEGNGKLVPAIFETLSEAFERVNAGGLKTSSGGSVFGLLRVEMVVPSYTMNDQAVLGSGKTVVLSTARTTDKDPYPFTGLDGAASVVTRGSGNNKSMILDNGVLTLENIVLDGGYDFGREAAEDGGIVRTGSNVTLTVTNQATLQNSKTSENGGAIWLGSGSSLSMSGKVEGCRAASGGGVYADAGFAKIDLYGSISDSRAETGDGGAVCASTGSSIVVYADAELKENMAKTNGGALCSDANVILRGAIGGTGAHDGNTATNGGGVYMGDHTTFTMYSTASICGNTATNGGGLYANDVARIAGGSIAENTARELGGAVYDNGSVSMSGGSMTANTAREQGGAVFVADNKTFTMTGGAINGGNRSPEGAITVGGINSVLNFSGNVKIQDNTDLDDTDVAKNVYLGFDSNRIIRTSGLGTNAYIGVYVANGDETYSLLYEHGIADRNFGTYTGSNPANARLEKFHNDRDQVLYGIAGDKQGVSASDFFVMWPGKNLYIKVLQKDDSAAIRGARFTLTNIKTGEEVWSGASGSDGLVTVPWSKIEAIGTNTAIFARNSAYLLRQSATNAASVLPGGDWLIHILEGNIVSWTTVNPGQTPSLVNNTVVLTPEEPEPNELNRTLDIELTPDQEKELGSTFILYNDRRPTITFNANGGRLYGGTRTVRTDTVLFGMNKSVTYTIKEKEPVWNTIFLNWNTEPDGTGEEYTKGDTHTFYRHTDNDDLVLYAHWVPVVCKITDRDGKLLYVDSAPAIYSTLESGCQSYLSNSFTDSNGNAQTARYIKMLVDSYELNAPITLTRGTSRLATGFLSTATSNDKKEDGYPFYSADGEKVCTILRGYDDDASMITVRHFNFGLENITLDGGAGEGKLVSVNGGIVSMEGSSFNLYIADGATLCNSETTGNGAAVYVRSNSTAAMTGGRISDNTVSGDGLGSGVYLSEGATFQISGAPVFAANVKDGEITDERNGGEDYTVARQDIYIAGYEAEDDITNAVSLVVTGNITSGDGSIWVWAAETPHYKRLQQFAIYTEDVTDVASTLKAFRNARFDSETEADQTGTYLHGVVRADDTGFNVFWGGLEGTARVMLVKVRKEAASYQALAGKSFTVYTDSAMTKVAKGKILNSLGEERDLELSSLVSGAGGAFFIGALPYGTYYVKEDGVGHFVIIVSENGVVNGENAPVKTVKLS